MSSSCISDKRYSKSEISTFTKKYIFTVLVSVGSIKRLVRSWTDRYPDAKVDPVNVWDDIITSR